MDRVKVDPVSLSTFSASEICLNTRKFGKPGLTDVRDFLTSRPTRMENKVMTQQRPGPKAKPQSEKFVPTMVKMKPRLRAELERLADEENMSLSAYLRFIAERHVQIAKAA